MSHMRYPGRRNTAGVVAVRRFFLWTQFILKLVLFPPFALLDMVEAFTDMREDALLLLKAVLEVAYLFFVIWKVLSYFV